MKNGWKQLISAGLCAVVTFLMTRLPVQYPVHNIVKAWLVIVSGVATLAFGVIAVANIWKYILFRDMFGVSSPAEKGGWKRIQMLKAIVEKELCWRASLLDSAIGNEKFLLDRCPDTPVAMKSHERKVQHASNDIQKYKKLFWRAHGLAKHFQFTVHKSYQDYRSN